MSKAVFGTATATLSLWLLGSAALASSVDTSLWTLAPSPRGDTGQTWTTSGNSATANFNNYGALVSDFALPGDFEYSGTGVNAGDDDIYGVVFNYVDADNFYYFGWEGGGFNDITGASGSWLVKEVSGVKTVLDSAASQWLSGRTYDFLVSRVGDTVTASWTQQGQTTPTVSLSATDSQYADGRFGFYTESQAANFSGLAGVDTPEVPLPAAPLLLISALASLAGASHLRRRS